MSRHRFVRNINIHEELDDAHYEEDDPFEGITPDQQAQLDSATDTVTNLLNSEKDSLISVAEIKRTLWDNYFDIDQTLEWAFEEQKRRKAAKEKKDQEDASPVEPPPPSTVPQSGKPLSALAKLAAAKSSTSRPSLATLASKSVPPPTTASISVAKPSLASLATSRSTLISTKQQAAPSSTPSTKNPPATSNSSSGAPPPPSKLSLLAQANARKSSSPSLARPKEVETSPLQSTSSPQPRQPSKLMQKIQKAREAAQTKPPAVEEHLKRSVSVGASTTTGEHGDSVVEAPSAEEPEVDPLFALTIQYDLSKLAALDLSALTSSLSAAAHISLSSRSDLIASPSPFASLLVPVSQDKSMNGHVDALKSIPTRHLPFGFDTPSPDDLVMSKREGTRLAAVTKASGGVNRKAESKMAASASSAAPGSKLVSGTKKERRKPPSGPPSRTSTPGPSPKKAVGGIKSVIGASGSSTPLRKGVTTSITSASGHAALSKPSTSSQPAPRSQLQADMDGLNLGDEDAAEGNSVEVELPPPKMTLAREKLLEEAHKAIEAGEGGKKAVSLVVIGHVDAGKSTLMGRLLYELGQMEERKRRENERESSKAGKGSFSWAWEMDGLGEERERGVTIDITQTTLALPTTNLTILDAPGHRDFIPNMISGASQADAALLVVDATVGEFEAGFAGGGQSREHVILVRSLGVGTIVVAINKLDMVEYSQTRYDEICSALKPFLVQSGYHPSKTVFVPCAAMAGVNLFEKTSEDVSSKKLAEWYNGQTLVDLLDKLTPPARAIDSPLRFPVSNVFKGGGGTLSSGIGVSGRLVSGVIQVGEKVRVLPGDETAIVRTIEHEEKLVPWAAAGSNVTLYLSGIDPVQLSVGSVLCPTTDVVPLAASFAAQVIVFDIKMPITAGAAVELFHHSRDNPATISKLVATLDRTSGAVLKANPRVLAKSSSAAIHVSLRSGTLSSGPVSKPVSIPIEPFSVNKEMGRILLRRGGETIAAGIVTEILG